MKTKKLLLVTLVFAVMSSTTFAYDNPSTLLNKRKRYPSYYNHGWVKHKLNRVDLLNELELPLKGPKGAMSVELVSQKGVESTIKEIPQETSQTKSWDFTNPDGTPLSTIFYKYQNSEWHRDRIVAYKDGNINLFTCQSYNKRLPNGTYGYDRVVYYKDDGVTVDFVRKYNYDTKTSKIVSVDNYVGTLNNNNITFTTYYGYDESGRKYILDTIYYPDGNKNK